MSSVRRGLLAAFLAVLVGAVLRVRARGAVPAATGGWRELRGPDYR